MPTENIDFLDPRDFIIIKNARVNNLKNLSVAIPRNCLVVVTGLSGSGKSSLAFDTLFAEGQRMYVESLSSYARQFLGRMEKPEVDYIRGVSPAIAIEQKANTRNPRSTVGTTTEIYDYLKLLFARIGATISPVSNREVTRDTVTSMVDFIMSLNPGSKVIIYAKLHPRQKRSVDQELRILMSKGFTRVGYKGEVTLIEDLLSKHSPGKDIKDLLVLIDRVSVQKDDEELRFRISDSIQTAFFEGQGDCAVETVSDRKLHHFSDRFELDGITFEEPSVNLFSFNNPYGACKNCEGFGKVLGIDEDLVIPDKSLSIYEGSVVPWRSEIMHEWVEPLIRNASKFNFPIHRPVNQLTKEQYRLLWKGNQYFKGIDDFFSYIESKTHKIQYRVMLSRYRGRTTCPECMGTRLRKDANYVKVNGVSISEVVLMPVSKCLEFFNNIQLSEYDLKVSKRILTEIVNRLTYLDKVGLGYLTLNRLTSTLSGGEYQRIKLATSLGSSLVGSMYILDEPSIGLHPRDTKRLVSVLKQLRDQGNTVIVVEHEEEVMRAADQILDIGPEAGTGGGQLIFQGTLDQMSESTGSYTAKYLKGSARIEIPLKRRKWRNSILIRGARENNLKNIDTRIPLDIMTVITGVSGSGKSTLIKKILYPALGKMLGIVSDISGKYDRIEGDFKHITQIEFVDQNPIGKSSRSNPVTYLKAFDHIRKLFADQSMAVHRGYKPSYFSFNVDGGRCEMCQGEGTIKVEMQFMADIYLTCENCNGTRYRIEILEITYKGKNISEILEMTVDESMDFFTEEHSIITRLKPLQDVGLGYIRLGQSSNSLSGGEAQRVKLASFLGKGGSDTNERILFIFDEPTTGLHFHDISKLLKSFNALIGEGHSIVVIEHNVEVIKNADWVIDLGPEGGDEFGGNVVFEGTPEDMVKNAKGYTAKFLKSKLK
ncbi:MAG TPA: excinuclease ABC subunit UvrA [Cyclobacteriaceae bacterium]|nr:excinuclease ABC subunit UvrA [Cyclobacteriaceae bacterium]